MSAFTKEMVDNYADKLLIGLSDEENAMVLKEFDVIEANMEFIANIPGIEKVEPMTYALDDFVYELNDDETEDSTDIDDLLKNCDCFDDREIKVPKVVE